MASRKKEYSETTRLELSGRLLGRLEQHPLFQTAHTVALYHALPDEVQTASFIHQWYRQKRLILPLVQGEELLLLQYEGPDSVEKGAFGIWEPKADCRAVAPTEIDLLIVPGVAFDRKGNRLGRGRGFYDRLLTRISAPKIGICFNFQLLDAIPTEPFDQQMDWILTDHETIDTYRKPYSD
ncbi:MAG: 5-formyltetrahydrofolate cyclo-ligase [Parabacteroides sp.]